MSTPSGPWYKTLRDGKAFQLVTTSEFSYSLPTFVKGKWVPGEWTPLVRNVDCCSTGYHLTQQPRDWCCYSRDFFQVFVAEGRGHSDHRSDASNKTAFAQVRLVRPVTPAEWHRLLSADNKPGLAMTSLWAKDPATKGWAAQAAKAVARAKAKEVQRLKKAMAAAKRAEVRRRAAIKAAARKYRVSQVSNGLNYMARLANRHHIVIPRLKSQIKAALKRVK